MLLNPPFSSIIAYDDEEQSVPTNEKPPVDERDAGELPESAHKSALCISNTIEFFVRWMKK